MMLAVDVQPQILNFESLPNLSEDKTLVAREEIEQNYPISLNLKNEGVAIHVCKSVKDRVNYSIALI